MRLDLHVHAKERSRCARAGEEEMIRAAISCGLDGIAFTDHNRLTPLWRLEELNKKHAPLRVFGGIEISVPGEDVLVLGLQDPKLETREWTYPELHTFVRQRGGFLVLAHPFRFQDTIGVDVETYLPDAIELRSVNIKVQDQDRIRALAERLNLRLLCNSDAHRARDVGRYYNLLPHRPRDDAELVSVLKDGGYRFDGDD